MIGERKKVFPAVYFLNRKLKGFMTGARLLRAIGCSMKFSATYH